MPDHILYGFLITSVLLAISPGPDVLFVISQTVTHGRKSGYAIVAGLLCGLVVHLSLFAFGISSLIVSSTLAFSIVKFLGGAYLLWLCVAIFRDKSSITIESSSTQKVGFFGFVQKGFWMNVLNPKVMMFFLGLFPGFLVTDSIYSIKEQVFILGLIFIGQALVVFGLICTIAGYFATFITTSKLFTTIIKWVQILLFGFLGIYLWFSLL
ncbi:LysE family translocator [Myroides sp. LJL116]